MWRRKERSRSSTTGRTRLGSMTCTAVTPGTFMLTRSSPDVGSIARSRIEVELRSSRSGATLDPIDFNKRLRWRRLEPIVVADDGYRAGGHGFVGVVAWRVDKPGRTDKKVCL